MGCMPSKYAHIYTSNEMICRFRPEFEALGYTEKEIGRLYRIFRKIDANDSGEIELAELLVYIDLERTPFTSRIFSIFDEDGSGHINFREFALSLWNYCTLGTASLVLFAFDIYDYDSSGQITCNEIYVMLQDCYGKSAITNRHAMAIISELKELALEGIPFDIDGFRLFAKTHPALLFPAFHVQESIQCKVLSVEFWEYYSRKRLELSNGVYVPIDQFLDLHINVKLYQEFVLGNTQIVKKPIKQHALGVIAKTGSMAKRKSEVMPACQRANSVSNGITRNSSTLGSAGHLSRNASEASHALTDMYDSAGDVSDSVTAAAALNTKSRGPSDRSPLRKRNSYS